MKKTYISPAIEIVVRTVQEPIMAALSGNPNSDQGDDGGVGSNEGMFDDDDDNGFTPVATSLWD